MLRDRCITRAESFRRPPLEARLVLHLGSEVDVVHEELSRVYEHAVYLAPRRLFQPMCGGGARREDEEAVAEGEPLGGRANQSCARRPPPLGEHVRRYVDADG